MGAAGAAASMAVAGLLNVRAASATRRPAVFCRLPSLSRGACRPPIAASVSVSTARLKRAQATQLTARTTPKNSDPLSRCSSTVLT